MKVQVYKCRFTGKLFENKDRTKYILHLKTLRKAKQKARLYARILNEFNTWLIKERSEIYELEDIIPWFMKNQKYIMDAANAISFSDDNKYQRGFHPDDEFKNINLNVKYSPTVSNSHQCPDNGMTNWCAKDKGPISYPGWSGRICGVLIRPAKHNWSYPASDALNLVGIKTGSGGGGNDNWAYDISIFVDDWTGLRGILIINKLKGII